MRISFCLRNRRYHKIAKNWSKAAGENIVKYTLFNIIYKKALQNFHSDVLQLHTKTEMNLYSKFKNIIRINSVTESIAPDHFLQDQVSSFQTSKWGFKKEAADCEVSPLSKI